MTFQTDIKKKEQDEASRCRPAQKGGGGAVGGLWGLEWGEGGGGLKFGESALFSG